MRLEQILEPLDGRPYDVHHYTLLPHFENVRNNQKIAKQMNSKFLPPPLQVPSPPCMKGKHAMAQNQTPYRPRASKKRTPLSLRSRV
eukprot:1406777-Amphidinium_carterae.1